MKPPGIVVHAARARIVVRPAVTPVMPSREPFVLCRRLDTLQAQQ